VASATISPSLPSSRLASKKSSLPAIPPTAGRSNLALAATAVLTGIQIYLQEINRLIQSPEHPSFELPALPAMQENPVQAAITVTNPTAEPARLAEHSTISADTCKANQSGGAKSELLLTDAIDKFLKNVEPPNREPKTYEEYRLVLYKFRDNCSKPLLRDVTRDDLLAFKKHLFSIGNEARTIFNRLGIVQQLFNEHGMEKLLKKGDKPKWVLKIREMYQPEDLEALFKACEPDEKIRYLFFLLTGERDKEVRYSSWDDIDFERQRVRLTSKKRLGFRPKDKEEREIPVPATLMGALKAYRARQHGPNPHNLLFSTREGGIERKFENKLKKIAYRAGLNCGRCLTKHGHKCSEGPHCSKWGLHKFRHTFATNSLESGVSIRTLQDWLGHSDLESTMVYLKLVKRKDINQLVDNSQLAGLSAPFMPEASRANAPASGPPTSST
jgi:integrase/recombinase XerD